MRVGIGLPSAIPGRDPRLLIDWARRAEEAGFTSLGVVDRVNYDSSEPLVALAAAAAVTTRIRLVSMVVIGPLHNPVLLARQAASLDALSEGRLTLGLGVGARREDYETAGVDYRRRGQILTEQLARIRDHWEDGQLGPTPVSAGGPDLLVGGASPAAFLRAARLADGYVHGGGPARSFAAAAVKVRAAWEEVDRPGSPQLWAQAYFGLSDADAVTSYLLDYYRFTGPFAQRIAEAGLSTATQLTNFIRAYEEVGCDELVLLPTIAELSEVERLASIVNR
ncbi:MAG TPA: LLM class flavin-dependent oxidoreductase [Acidimicrobiia bacterium]|nr:LLM class flavin-dependent oxidoreductase [Acidimicrobiia bacterium]